MASCCALKPIRAAPLAGSRNDSEVSFRMGFDTLRYERLGRVPRHCVERRQGCLPNRHLNMTRMRASCAATRCTRSQGCPKEEPSTLHSRSKTARSVRSQSSAARPWRARLPLRRSGCPAYWKIPNGRETSWPTFSTCAQHTPGVAPAAWFAWRA